MLDFIPHMLQGIRQQKARPFAESGSLPEIRSPELVDWLGGLNQLLTRVYHDSLLNRQVPTDSSPIRCELMGNDALPPIRKSLECCNQQYGLLTTVVPLQKLIAEYRYPPHRGGNTEYLVSPVMGCKGKGQRSHFCI